jgi:hypothetical protein
MDMPAMQRRFGGEIRSIMRRSARIDGRLTAARRVKELTAAFLDQLPVADATTLAAVKKAAELVAVAEGLRRKALLGEVVDMLALVRVENLAQRAIVALNLDRKREPTGPSLSDYLAGHYATGQPDDEAEDESGTERRGHPAKVSPAAILGRTAAIRVRTATTKGADA